MESLASSLDQEADLPITSHQQLTCAVKIPFAVRIHRNRSRCHLHIEHGREQGERGIREISARSHRDQLDREAVGAGPIGINLEGDQNQPICR